MRLIAPPYEARPLTPELTGGATVRGVVVLTISAMVVYKLFKLSWEWWYDEPLHDDEIL